MAVARETAAQQQGWRGARMNLSSSRSWGTCCTSGGLVHRCVLAHWQQAWCPQCRRSGLYPSAAAVIVPVFPRPLPMRGRSLFACVQGQTKLNKLPLRQIDNLEALEVGCIAAVGLAEVVCPAAARRGLHVAHSSAGLSTNLVYPFFCAQELPKELVESHYPTTEQLPDYFTNTEYIRFTPEVDCLALPGERALTWPKAEPGSWGVDCT